MDDNQNEILSEYEDLVSVIVLFYPFATPLIKIPLKFCEDGIAKTNGNVIFINPIVWKKLNKSKKYWVILHEYFHIAFFDFIRGEGKDPDIWNKAADFSNNATIIEWCNDINIELIDGALYDPIYSNMSTEEIYIELQQEIDNKIKNKNQNGNQNQKQSSSPMQSNKKGNSSIGKSKVVSKDELIDKMKNSKDGTEKTDQDIISGEASSDDISNLKQDVLVAAEHSKKVGKLPLGIDRKISEMITSKTNWKNILANLFKKTIMYGNSRTYQYPKKWSYQFGIILPGEVGKNKLNIVLIIDTSGSINKKLLEQFVGEIKKILPFTSKCTIITADAKVHEKITIRNINEIIGINQSKIQFKGGGGTNFVPALQEAKKIRPDICIYLTDGFGNYGEPVHGLNLIWALTGRKHKIPPFGKTIIIE